MNVTAQQLNLLKIGSEWVEPINTTLAAFGINSKEEVSAFIAQCSHESGNFRLLEENLNYKAETLMKLWPTRFNTSNVNDYAHNPQKIANKVYSGRMGNRDEASGDGYRFRGRGVIQLTGHDNYWHCGQAINMDFVAQPDLVATPMYAAMSGGWFWKTHGCNVLADQKDWVALTKRINGGTIGLEDRIALTNHAASVFA